MSHFCLRNYSQKLVNCFDKKIEDIERKARKITGNIRLLDE